MVKSKKLTRYIKIEMSSTPPSRASKIPESPLISFPPQSNSPPLNCLFQVPNVGSGSYRPVVTCRKKEIHPEFYEDAKVYCKGELVMTTGGTQKEYVVDVWSGNHPFYLGNRSGLLVDDDQVEKFRKKYGGLTEIMEIPVLKGEIVLPSRKKGASKGGKKK